MKSIATSRTTAKPATPPTMPPASTGAGGVLLSPPPPAALLVAAEAEPVLEARPPPAAPSVVDVAMYEDPELSFDEEVMLVLAEEVSGARDEPMVLIGA